MTVRELREGIRQLTSAVNVKIAEYFSGKSNKSIEKMIGKLVKNTQYTSRYTGEARTPVGKDGGYLGLGLSGKNKQELERQYNDLLAFNKNERFSVQYREIESEKAKKSYKTFCDRYGYVTGSEWLDFVDTMNDVKNYLADFGYEDIGGSVARAYAESDARGKRRMGSYIRRTGRQMRNKGGTPEDFVDALNELLIEEGVIDE